MIDPRLVLEQREAVLQQLLRRFEHIPAEISLSDEPLAERRSAGSSDRLSEQEKQQ